MKYQKNLVTRKRIKNLLSEGVYDPKEIFDTIYPTYMGHYYTLRKLIAEVKNGY